MAAGAVEVNITSNNSKQCAIFDGVDDYIKNMNITIDKAWSIAFSLYTKDGNRNSILGDITANAGYLYCRDGTKDVAFEPTVDGRGVTLEFDSYGTIIGKWVHYVITAIPTAMNLYMDGAIMDNSPQVPVANDISFNITQIGRAYTAIANSYIKGGLSNLQIYNRELTATEALKLSQGNSIKEGLIHNWKFKDYTDSIGSADGTNDGTTLGIIDDAIGAAIKADRTGANDKYICAGTIGGQVTSVIIEEA